MLKHDTAGFFIAFKSIKWEFHELNANTLKPSLYSQKFLTFFENS